MKSDVLQKHYNQLTARERFALLIAAGLRGDEEERRALANSAPRQTWQVQHNFGVGLAFDHVFSIYLSQQYETALAMMLLTHMPERIKKDLADIDTMKAFYLSAYVFCTRWDAWHDFCAEIGIQDVDALLTRWCGGNVETLKIAEKIARAVTYTVEEAQAALTAEFGDDAKVITRGETLADYRQAFEHVESQRR